MGTIKVFLYECLKIFVFTNLIELYINVYFNKNYYSKIGGL